MLSHLLESTTTPHNNKNYQILCPGRIHIKETGFFTWIQGIDTVFSEKNPVSSYQ